MDTLKLHIDPNRSFKLGRSAIYTNVGLQEWAYIEAASMLNCIARNEIADSNSKSTGALVNSLQAPIQASQLSQST